MDKLQVQAAKEMTWRDHLTRHAASGKSIAAFCRAEDISQANFYAWRTKLRGGVVGLTVASTDTAFIDLGAVSRPAADQDITPLPTLRAVVNSSIELRIDLGGGLVLTITRR
jgi:hypothetical protein